MVSYLLKSSQRASNDVTQRLINGLNHQTDGLIFIQDHPNIIPLDNISSLKIFRVSGVKDLSELGLRTKKEPDNVHVPA